MWHLSQAVFKYKETGKQQKAPMYLGTVNIKSKEKKKVKNKLVLVIVFRFPPF